jgi:fatty acid CoA ligase FadD9
MSQSLSSAPTDAGRDERRQRRIAEMYANDQQFVAARPRAAVAAAVNQPDLQLHQIVRATMQGYADRPALGQRAVEFVCDPLTGRTSVELLPRFDTISYGELWKRARAVAAALSNTASRQVRFGDRVCMLGFASIDYATVDIALTQLGAVAVPLQAGTAAHQLRSIVAECEPTAIACSVDYLADAVELVSCLPVPTLLVVFDHHPEVDDHREALGAAVAAQRNSATVETLTGLCERGEGPGQDDSIPTRDGDDLALLIYTSGSTGAPKGAMYPARTVAGLWRPSDFFAKEALPLITLNFMPMSHGAARGVLYGTLGNGGTAYFVAKSDLSTLLEDLALVRPTQLNLVPRIWDTVFDAFRGELDRRLAEGADSESVKADVMAEFRQNQLGGRVLSAMTGSAPISVELKEFVESVLDVHLGDGYGATECGLLFLDGRALRPQVIDYKLVDVPELGYFRTDLPHPRGELLVKTQAMFPGYYKRPDVTAEMFDSDGYYRTGDIVAETGPDEIRYVDRRNNVLKLSQGEFVTVANLEAAFTNSRWVRQIYVYGNSGRPYLLAVIVPTETALHRPDAASLKQQISRSLQDVAKATGLQSYEIPRDFIIEPHPFTMENGLLTGLRKLARPKLRERYGEDLERLYAELAAAQASELSELRQAVTDRPVLDTITRAAGALLGTATAELGPDVHFTDIGGDSLSALAFAKLLNDIFDVDVPVSVLVSPTSDLRTLAEYVKDQRRSGHKRPSFASVHGSATTEVAAADLSLDKFVDIALLTPGPSLPRPDGEVRTVLLTGATGFLGRFLALAWLERLAAVDGRLICLVRGKDITAARTRLDDVFDSGDPELLAHYRGLAGHLEVVAGDKAEANLGLDPQTWQRLANTVDLIVDPAALVNHVLPYSQMFGPNVVGTAELIRLALTARTKPYTYVSTGGLADQIGSSAFVEDADIRQMCPTRKLDDSYANGYGTSKWAGEVLLREAHDAFGLPVAVFRCDMILADTRYHGQLNLPDMFTRLMLSLVATELAPVSFYQLDSSGRRQRAHYDGLPVDFIAEAICVLGGNLVKGHETYHVMNPHDDGIGLDEYVDWLIDAGYGIRRIADFNEWRKRFEHALRALPDRQRENSSLPLMHAYRRPEKPIRGSVAPAGRFRAAVDGAQIGSFAGIPHVTPPIIEKYISSLQILGLL